ncbi:MAG: Gfo/Idh/MocA family oxidoreductase [Proteobacteria bacterium]|nr:Gfo/Idh/MocA family oxidoreductase [Pseudomonadota bacterium]
MGELRLGIIGLGSAGGRRLTAALAHPRVTVAATADPTVPGLASTVHVATGEELLRLPDLDAVCIAVPTAMAPELTQTALGRGLHVLVEKPPGRSASEFRRVLAGRNGHVLRVGFNHRLHGSLQEAHRVLASGLLGRLEAVDAVYERPWLARPNRWRSEVTSAGGGILLDQGIHLLDALRWLLGPLTVRAHEVHGAPMEKAVEATLDAMGTTVRLTSRADAPYCRFALTLRGKLGTLTLSGLETSSRAYAPERLDLVCATRTESARWDHDPSWGAELGGFVRHCLDGLDDGHGDPADALEVLRLVDQLRSPAQVEARL